MAEGSDAGKAGRAVRDLDDWGRALFEGVDDAVFVHDLQGRILEANEAACRRLGYTREELLRLKTCDIDHPDFATGFADRLREQLERGRLSCEGLHRTRDGRIIHVDINTSVFRIDGRMVILAVMRDISERKLVEEKLQRQARALEEKNRALSESEMRYGQLAEATPDALVVADPWGKITLFNPAAEKLFGYEAAQLLGMPFRRLVPLDYSEEADRGFANYAFDRPLVGATIELHGRRMDGSEVPLDLTVGVLGRGADRHFLAALRDLTERNRIRALLVRNEKLASIGLLSAGVAHEINNPLAFVSNNLAVLERDSSGLLELLSLVHRERDRLSRTLPDLAERAQQIADAIDLPFILENWPRLLNRTREGVDRVTRIVHSLRGLARTDAPRRQDVNLADLVDASLEIIRARLRRHQIDIRTDFGPTHVRCVPTQMSQVLLNLVINALQAVESARRGDQGWIRIATRQADRELVIEIADNGTGIDPDHLENIFDPFFTTKDVGEGTGLGLSISHNIVAGHGGRIEVHSQPGEGTTFRIYLPAPSRDGETERR
jgi:PAS domain S-box-containing protein